MAYVRRRNLADGSKRYECCWRDAITRQERSKSFVRKGDADAFGKLVDADQLRGVNVPAPSDGLKTVAQVVGRWYSVHSPTLKPKTAHSYANLITSRILPALGSARLNKLRFSDVQSWVGDGGRGPVGESHPAGACGSGRRPRSGSEGRRYRRQPGPWDH